MSHFLQIGENRGGVTLAATAKDVAQANSTRRGLTFQNTSDTEMHITETGIDCTETNGYRIAPSQSINISTNMRVSVWCLLAGKTYAATEF